MNSNLYAFFWGKEGPYRCFSQWYPSEFRDDAGLVYCNCEQYMMAHKAALFGDTDTFQAIMNETDPAKIKKLGRLVKHFDEDIWKQNRYNIVFQGNYLKFTQNSNLKTILLGTNNRIIAEASPYDDIWGIGLRESVAKNKPRSEWPGMNLLGQALMLVRDMIRKD